MKLANSATTKELGEAAPSGLAAKFNVSPTANRS